MIPTHRDSTSELLGAVLAADPCAVGRAITTVLEGGAAGETLHGDILAHAGRAHRVGVTGPPGVGKSTLVAALARRLVDGGERLGVVATDPRSPRTGGAFLGDRVRLAGFRLTAEPAVFFRSLAATPDGAAGERPAAARAADVLDAAGYEWVFVETVGVGQSDVAIRDLVHTVVLVLAPDQGDEIQLLKAGILEIADIFVVSRGPGPHADRFRALLDERIAFAAPARADEAAPGGAPAWSPRVVITESLRGDGLDELLSALREHREGCQRGRVRSNGAGGDAASKDASWRDVT